MSPGKRVIKLKVMQVVEAGQWQDETHGIDEGRHVLESHELALSVTTWAHIYEHKMSFFFFNLKITILQCYVNFYCTTK